MINSLKPFFFPQIEIITLEETYTCLCWKPVFTNLLQGLGLLTSSVPSSPPKPSPIKEERLKQQLQA